jgi:TetR/AcrR family transcriptional repressor of bet genes
MTARKKVAPKRTASKEERRAQLIEATIRCIAHHGLSDTTTAQVSSEAGLSQGIINLHFKSKDKLLLATLEHVVDEYKTLWEKVYAQAGASSAEKLLALVGVDFHSSVCERDKLAVWFAFWSESKARPTYRRLCADRDRDYDRAIKRLCADIVAEGGYAVNPEDIANALTAMTEGLWLDMLVNSRGMSRQQARQTSLAYLGHVFPQHFPVPEAQRKTA